MELKWKKKSIFLVFAAAFLLLFTQTSFADENISYKTMTYEGNVELDKGWTVRMSAGINQNTLNKNNVQIVLDETNEVIPIEIKFDPAQANYFKILPVQNYLPEKTYSIYVKNITASSGKKLDMPSRKQFTTKRIGTITANAKVEVSAFLSTIKKVTVTNTTLKQVSYFKVGKDGELLGLGQTLGVATEKGEEDITIYFYAADASYVGSGVLNVEENGPRRVFDIDTMQASNGTEGAL